jgi:hypothetical protein
LMIISFALLITQPAPILYPSCSLALNGTCVLFGKSVPCWMFAVGFGFDIAFCMQLVALAVYVIRSLWNDSHSRLKSLRRCFHWYLLLTNVTYNLPHLVLGLVTGSGRNPWSLGAVIVVHLLVEWFACRSDMHVRVQAWLSNRGHKISGPAVTLAGLFEGQDPQVLVAVAVSRFLCISWDVLLTMPKIIVGGGPLDVVGKGRADLHNVSEPCHIGECDAFFNSWHDNAQQKWETLSNWSWEFERNNTHSPRLWLDKVCIDQKNINADLQCLPIFLAACNILLVISGRSDTSRLWFCVELFVYVQMLVDDNTLKAPNVLTIGANDEERALVREGWTTFDAAASEGIS